LVETRSISYKTVLALLDWFMFFPHTKHYILHTMQWKTLTQILILPLNFGSSSKKCEGISTLHYNWFVSAHASQAFSTSSIPIV